MTKWYLFLECKDGSAYENHIKSMKRKNLTSPQLM